MEGDGGGKSGPVPHHPDGNDLRTIEIEGAPWFVAADACRCLGLPYGGATGSTGRHLRRLSREERRVVDRTEAFAVPLFAGHRSGSLTLITESGLYKLIMRSDKATARPFQDWVTKDVLPWPQDRQEWYVEPHPQAG